MSYFITPAPTVEEFKRACANLSLLGQENHERIQITKSLLGYIPQVTSQPSWIERILYFFGYKKRALRLQEVAHFSLNWLRANALKYSDEFYLQTEQVKKLELLMKKAKLAQEFNELLENVSTRVKATQAFNQQIEDFRERSNHLNTNLTRCLQIANRAELLADAFNRRLEILDATLSLDTNLTHDKTTKAFKQKIEEFHEKSNRLDTSLDRCQQIASRAELLADVLNRRLEVLDGTQLFAKGYSNEIVKWIVHRVHEKKLVGFVPCTLLAHERFCEKSCPPLACYFMAPAKKRLKMAEELVNALKNLHELNFSNFTYSIKTQNGIIQKTVIQVPLYHGNISTETVLVDQSVHPVFSNLEELCDVVGLKYTTFFRSPEKVKFIENNCYCNGSLKETLTAEDIGYHHLQYGQISDVWSLGLVIATLLSGGKTLPGTDPKHGIPHLKFLKDSIKSQVKDKSVNEGLRVTPLDAAVQDVTQEKVDESINQLIKECNSPPELQRGWDLVRKMLTVDPERRINVTDALRCIN